MGDCADEMVSAVEQWLHDNPPLTNAALRAKVEAQDATITDLRARLETAQNHVMEMSRLSVLMAEKGLALKARLAEAEKLAWAARSLKTYLRWTIGPESPGYHPTMPSAVDAFLTALTAWEASAPVISGYAASEIDDEG